MQQGRSQTQENKVGSNHRVVRKVQSTGQQGRVGDQYDKAGIKHAQTKRQRRSTRQQGMTSEWLNHNKAGLNLEMFLLANKKLNR